MVNEKTYFHFRIGNWRFYLKQNHEYTERETGKVHMSKLFKIDYYKATEHEYVNDNWLSFYTGWRKPCFVYDTIEYEGNRHNLHISLGWGILYLYFPWRNKHADEEDVNNPQPKYGFYLYGEQKLFDSFWYYKNKNGKSQAKCIYMPWTMEFHRHSILLKDGTWWTMLEKERRKARRAGIDTWHDERFDYHAIEDKILKREYPFTYTTKDGEVQHTTATCYIEEREWRQKWLRWTRLFHHVRTDLEISFADEMGNQRGSWKGGVLGVSGLMTKEEKANADMESALRRYEEKVNRIHDYDR